MGFKFRLSQCFIFLFCVFLKSVLTLDPYNHSTKEDLKKGDKILTVSEHLELDTGDVKVGPKSNHTLEGPSGKPTDGKGQVNKDSFSKKEPSKLVLEGGGIIDLTSTALPNRSLMETEIVNVDDNHSKGSKPRKGVQHPGSSVVPRKGVDPLEAFNPSQSSGSITTGSIKEAAFGDKQPLNKTEVKPEQQEPIVQTKKISHPKKPVVVTDSEDVDDFDKYPIIQTSTTGEDYIIIGIVIVLGIWCSIFGALIFYRRAGEYWDRRHYRRMDFLVEGMYND